MFHALINYQWKNLFFRTHYDILYKLKCHHNTFVEECCLKSCSFTETNRCYYLFVLLIDNGQITKPKHLYLPLMCGQGYYSTWLGRIAEDNLIWFAVRALKASHTLARGCIQRVFWKQTRLLTALSAGPRQDLVSSAIQPAIVASMVFWWDWNTAELRANIASCCGLPSAHFVMFGLLMREQLLGYQMTVSFVPIRVQFRVVSCSWLRLNFHLVTAALFTQRITETGSFGRFDWVFLCDPPLFLLSLSPPQTWTQRSSAMT